MSASGAISRAHDALLGALELDEAGVDQFRARTERRRFDRVFGGQLLAQALVAAGRTAPGQAPDSLHAFFVGPGQAGEPLDLDVTRVRDGRSVSTRRVGISQGGRPLLEAMASFHGLATVSGDDVERTVALSPPDDALPIQHWAAAADGGSSGSASSWIERPPAVELRIAEPTYFLGGPWATGPRTHWMRAGGDAGADPLLHAALLAYASDYFLLDMGFRAHPSRRPMGELLGLSLDHAIWFHRPVAFGGWHRHTQDLAALDGERGLVHGAIHDERGDVVASVAQAILVRVRSPQ